jgi:hypothetical protein
MGSFALQLGAFANKTTANLDQIARKVVLDLGTRLVEKSPVGDPSTWQGPAPEGYVGGRFRANWQYAFDRVNPGDLPDIDASGALSIGRISAGVQSAPGAGIHYLFNNLPYAQKLEDGWSKQAPSGMVATTILEFEGVVTRIATGNKK